MGLSNMLNHASGSSSTGSYSQLPPLATPEKPAKRARSYDEDEDEREEDEGRDGTPIEEDELYITLQTQVVGVQYYNGLVGAGEYVMLRRQPTNQFDSNAIQVINSRGTQVGHIPKTVASLLASLMDKKLVKVEGRMIGQNLDGFKRFKLNMDISIYARPSLREVLEPELAWATPGQMGFKAMREAEAQGLLDQIKAASKNKSPAKKRGGRVGVSGTGGSDSGLQQAIIDPEIRRLLDGLKKVGQDEKEAAGVMDSLTADIDVSKLPLHPSPPGTDSGELLVDLLPHQSQALQWMISHENPKLPATPEDPAVQFWTKQKGQTPGGDYWLNVATCSPQSTEPVLGRGGILADGMGLGKTLTTLSLILATKKDKPTGDYSNATLIVCPLSVLSNWEKQIHDHVTQGGLTSYTYHGDAKSVTARTLSNYDVVFTTYGTVSNGANLPPVWHTPSTPKKLKSHDGPLLQVKWKRVVADEGHQLRNPKSKMARAFAALQAERRWICTGTPIVNSSADFGSLLTCLKICSPLDNPDYFRTLLSRPLKDGNASAGKVLQALVGQILLRRTKDSRDTDGRRLVDLPPIEYFQVPVQLDEETRDLYDQIQEVSTEALITGQGTANVLSMVTRMRQLCLCKSLVPQSFFDELRHPPPVKGAAVAVSAIPEEKKQELLDKLRQNVADNEDCSICFEAPMNNPNITDCGHSYCLPCIDEWLHRDQICPFCRHAITLASLLALPPDETYVEPPETPDVTEHRSAKVKELVKYLKVFDAKDKTLVFSQFTSFLNIVAGALKEEGITHCRFDGTMSAKKRQEVIAQFQRPVTELNKSHTPKVMLISLMSGAVGLNLTAASNVFLCDPWWQSAIEAQAIDRVHRMGQRKTVRVFQLIAEDTVEARVLDIQKTKDGIVTKAFEKTSKEEKKLNKKEARYEELKLLLGVKPDATAGAGPSAAE